MNKVRTTLAAIWSAYSSTMNTHKLIKNSYYNKKIGMASARTSDPGTSIGTVVHTLATYKNNIRNIKTQLVRNIIDFF
jgi:hypothetical protein